MSDDTFDALPKSTPDEYGSWAKGKAQGIRDVFPTPEAFKAYVDAVAHRVWQPFPCVTMEIDEGMAPDEWRLENRNAK